MPESHIERIDEAFEIASRFETPVGNQVQYAFRGHANKSYRLEPTLSRLLSPHSPTEEDAISIESRITFEYMRRSKHLRPREAGGVFGGRTAEIEHWQTMQHYGAPTRLLDWTRSFYVALYFAVSSEPNVDGSVLVVDVSSLDNWSGKSGMPRKSEDFNQFIGETPTAIVYSPSADFERAIIQQGLFTFPTHLVCDHNSLYQGQTNGTHEEMQRITIASTCKPRLLSQLVSMNVTAATLFPGLDGIARSICDLATICTVTK